VKNTHFEAPNYDDRVSISLKTPRKLDFAQGQCKNYFLNLFEEEKMSDVSPLSSFYKQYTDGNLSKRELEAGIFKHMLDSSEGHYGLFFKNRSDRIDFLCWFYPALRCTIDRYDDKLASFGVYIVTTLRYAFRYYKRRKRKRTATEINCWNASNDELFVCEPEMPDGTNEDKLFSCRLNSPKYVLLVLLKSYYYVSDSLIDKAAAVIGMKAEVLGEMVDMLRRLQIKKIGRLQKLSNAAHCLYYRCLTYERKLSEKSENTTLTSLISMRLDKSRKRLANMRERLKAMRIEATNSELSEVLGIPKGTVDSRMASIKNKKRSMS
jgi:DNA-directed RNA polymerase specialized sigma24 family protein